MATGGKRSTKWGDTNKVKFGHLVDTKMINWRRNESVYLRQVRDKYWHRRKTPTFRANWKATTAQFRTEELLNGARSKLEEGKICIFFELPFLPVSNIITAYLIF